MAAKNEKRQFIKIRGANEHNLKNIDLDIPRNELIVLTGLSGSGKSSLAFDTIYAEGQRRYMESLSSYARQFLGQMEKPDVESIEGLSPAISIDQKSTNRNPRSTVGTVTEIYDYFRLLYARIGIPHCPKCGREIKKQTVDQMVDQIMELPERTKIQLLAPVVRGRKGRHEKLLERAKKSGYVRVRVDGNLYELSEEIALDKNIKHNIEIIVDRLVVKPGIEKRLTDSIENVLHLAEGLMIVDIIDGEPVPCDGRLYFQGQNVNNLVRKAHNRRFLFEETTYLLLFGNLPTEHQLKQFINILGGLRELSGQFVRDVIMKAPSANIMNALEKSIVTLYSYDENPEDISVENVLRQSLQLISKVPVISVFAYCETSGSVARTVCRSLPFRIQEYPLHPNNSSALLPVSLIHRCGAF